MSDTFEVRSSSGNYKVSVGHLLKDVCAAWSDAIIVVDSKLVNHLPEEMKRRIVVDALEDNKSLEAAPDYIAAMRRLGANRGSHMVAIGGGIIQDVATFIASIYMRGIKWTYLPTTVLAMVDSCIGGKSSINVGGYKNLVGNYYPPDRIVIDLNFIVTLDTEMIVGGLFEAAKICYARSPARFEEYMAMQPSKFIAPEDLRPIVMLALDTKKWFIETDEFDQNERLLLNFGHTFGHALESATDFGVSHGIGVGVGMLCACCYSERFRSMSGDGQAHVRKLKSHVLQMLGIGTQPVISSPPKLDLDLVMQKFEFDKKHSDKSYRIVVPSEVGALELASFPRSDKIREMIRSSFKQAFEEIGWSYSDLSTGSA